MNRCHERLRIADCPDDPPLPATRSGDARCELASRARPAPAPGGAERAAAPLIRQLQRMQFGRRSEKLDPDQLALALEDLEQAVAESDAEAEKADRELRRRAAAAAASRGALPATCRGSRW